MLSSIPVPREFRDFEIARIGMIAELDAINLYEQLARSTDNQILRETLLSIAEEEKVHLGEFMTHILSLDLEHIEDGIREVCDRAELYGVELDVCKSILSPPIIPKER